MNAEEVLKVVGLLGLPFLGWLVVVGPLLVSATVEANREGRLTEHQDRRQLFKLFVLMFALWCLTVILFLTARLLGEGLALI